MQNLNTVPPPHPHTPSSVDTSAKGASWLAKNSIKSNRTNKPERSERERRRPQNKMRLDSLASPLLGCCATPTCHYAHLPFLSRSARKLASLEREQKADSSCCPLPNSCRFSHVKATLTSPLPPLCSPPTGFQFCQRKHLNVIFLIPQNG